VKLAPGALEIALLLLLLLLLLYTYSQVKGPIRGKNSIVKEPALKKGRNGRSSIFDNSFYNENG